VKLKNGKNFVKIQRSSRFNPPSNHESHSQYAQHFQHFVHANVKCRQPPSMAKPAKKSHFAIAEILANFASVQHFH